MAIKALNWLRGVCSAMTSGWMYASVQDGRLCSGVRAAR